MVSLRCKLLVKDELRKLYIRHVIINLGVVDIMERISPEQVEQLKINLMKSGKEILDDKKSILIEKLKSFIIEMIHYSDEIPVVNYSDYISEKSGRLHLSG